MIGNLIKTSHSIIIDCWYWLRKFLRVAIMAVFTLDIWSDYYISLAGNLFFVNNPVQY